MKLLQVPWAQNYGQEKLLLSLINGTFLETTFLDTKLGSFDPNLKGSKLYNFLRETAQKFTGMAQVDATQQVFLDMPFQTLVLIANLISEGRFILGGPTAAAEAQGKFAYYHNGGTTSLYVTPVQSPDDETQEKYIQDQNMNINKFGNFWFDHMNIVEIQYLEGYEKTEKIQKIKIDVENSIYPSATQLGTTDNFYENAYNSSVKAFRWTPLTLPKFHELRKHLEGYSVNYSQKQILCRATKTKMPFFNSKVYGALDLPLYDEYFFLTEEALTASKINAYVIDQPNITPAYASPESFKMRHFGISTQNSMSTQDEFAAPEETQEISSVSTAVFEDDNE